MEMCVLEVIETKLAHCMHGIGKARHGRRLNSNKKRHKLTKITEK